MKKRFIILIAFIISIFVSTVEKDFVLNNCELMLQIIFTFLGLSFTSYTFVFSPLSRIYKKYDSNIKKQLMIHLMELESNLKYIFYFSVVIIICNFLLNCDIPFISNPHLIDFGLFQICDLKSHILNSIICFCSLLSGFTFYDIMKSAFIVLRGSLDVDIDI